MLTLHISRPLACAGAGRPCFQVEAAIIQERILWWSKGRQHCAAWLKVGGLANGKTHHA